MSKTNKCIDHCLLWVKINNRQTLLDAMIPRRSRRISITDHHSEEAKISAERRRRFSLPLIDEKYRYFGVISSLNYVKGPDISEHIRWIMSNIKPSFRLIQWAAEGGEYGLSHGWWSGIGTGYGPKISPEIGELLAIHNINLEISLYG